MANHQYDNSQLTPGEVIRVQGKLGYNNATRPYKGEELEKRRKEQQARGRRPYSDKYYEVVDVTVTEPQIVPKTPGQLTVGEAYVQERFYSTNGGQRAYQIIRANAGLPSLGKTLDGVHVSEIEPKGYIRDNPVVTLFIRVFKGAGAPGLTLDALVVNGEPVFGGTVGQLESTLSQFGMIWEHKPADDATRPLEEPAAPVAMPEPVPYVAPAQAAAPAAAAPVVPNPIMEAASQAASLYTAPPEAHAQGTPGIRYDSMQ